LPANDKVQRRRTKRRPLNQLLADRFSAALFLSRHPPAFWNLVLTIDQRSFRGLETVRHEEQPGIQLARFSPSSVLCRI
jgi:hypothetical protein